jgi:uncharacterized protein YxjI
MIIDIRQNKFSIGDKYRVSVNGTLKYVASRQPIQLMAEILVFNASSDILKAKINKHFHLFKANYEITFSDGTICFFQTVSYLRSHYNCQIATDIYDIYGHRGRKYSIYRNDQQIAWWEKEMITLLEGDEYKITANEDCNAELLICFCLIIDNYANGNHGENVLTINWGYLGLQARKFDKTWRP